jgi:hypothetical protein
VALLRKVVNSTPLNVKFPEVGNAGKLDANSNMHLGLGASFPAFLYLNEIEIEVALRGTTTSL